MYDDFISHVTHLNTCLKEPSGVWGSPADGGETVPSKVALGRRVGFRAHTAPCLCGFLAACDLRHFSGNQLLILHCSAWQFPRVSRSLVGWWEFLFLIRPPHSPEFVRFLPGRLEFCSIFPLVYRGQERWSLLDDQLCLAVKKPFFFRALTW